MFSGRLSKPEPSGWAVMSKPNLVARTTSSRKSSTALPRRISLLPVPEPYSSAVSKKSIPSSRARRMVAMLSSLFEVP